MLYHEGERKKFVHIVYLLAKLSLVSTEKSRFVAEKYARVNSIRCHISVTKVSELSNIINLCCV